jgi:hypothetical protein
MPRYCLDTHTDNVSVIHDVGCPDYDLGTLLGLGCVSDLGEFPTLAVALEAIRHSHPMAVRCQACCQAQVTYLPQLWQPQAISALAG